MLTSGSNDLIDRELTTGSVLTSGSNYLIERELTTGSALTSSSVLHDQRRCLAINPFFMLIKKN